MVIKRRTVWTSLLVGAALVPSAAPSIADAAAAASAAALDAASQAAGAGHNGYLITVADSVSTQGGEGGEGGVDFEKAALDPAVFLIALDVIRAHYLCGRDAYLEGNKEAGAQMFAHPIGEVYVGLAPVVAKLGIADFEGKMQDAVGLASAGGDVKAVAAAVNDVLAALDAAGAKAPRSQDSKVRIEAQVLGEILNRAALQYSSAQAPDATEARLDGYGFYKAAAARAPVAMPMIAAQSPEAAQLVQAALDGLARAFPSATGPAPANPPEPGVVLAAISKAGLALSGLR